MSLERKAEAVVGRALCELAVRPRSRWFVLRLIFWKPLTCQERWLWMSMSQRLANDRTALKFRVRELEHRLGEEASI
jgi:hypothetical protein